MPRIVQRSRELARIIGLPRRRWEDENDAEACRLLTEHLKRPGGQMVLYPVQCAALAELVDFGGCFAQAGVGQGKTLISALAASIFEIDRPILFVPAKLKDKTVREFRSLNEHFKVSPIRVESYEQLSRAESGPILLGETVEELWRGYLPILVVLDEAHKAKNPKAACTRKLRRYIRERRRAGYPVIVIVMSGTLAKRSIKDFYHLAQWTDPLWELDLEKLRENVEAGRVDRVWLERIAGWAKRCPMPEHDHEILIWADAVDEGVSDTKRAEPGALLLLGGDGPDAQTKARRGLQKRIFETPGYIATTRNDVPDCSLVIECHQIDVPDEVDAAFDKIKHWETPCGLPIDSGIEIWRNCRQLATDFYYRPRTKPPTDWLKARRDWFSWARYRLQYNHQSLDSLAMIERETLERGDHGCPKYERGDDGCKACAMWDAYVAWKKIEDSYELETLPVWVGRTCLDHCVRWAEDGPGLIWVEWPIVGERIARELGVHYYGRKGLNSRKEPIEGERGDRCAVASIKANGEGRNLQKIWSRALVTSMPPTGLDAEQMFARLHRPGQPADEVHYDIMIACREQRKGLLQALKDANFHLDVLGSEMKLNGGKTADLVIPKWRERGWAWREPIRV